MDSRYIIIGLLILLVLITNYKFKQTEHMTDTQKDNCESKKCDTFKNDLEQCKKCKNCGICVLNVGNQDIKLCMRGNKNGAEYVTCKEWIYN